MKTTIFEPDAGEHAVRVKTKHGSVQIIITNTEILIDLENEHGSDEHNCIFRGNHTINMEKIVIKTSRRLFVKTSRRPAHDNSVLVTIANDAVVLGVVDIDEECHVVFVDVYGEKVFNGRIDGKPD